MTNITRSLIVDGVITCLVTNGGTAKAAGRAILLGGVMCVHKNAAAANETNCVVVVGGAEVYYDKTTGQAWTVGEKLYYDSATDKLTNVAGALVVAGICARAAASGDTFGYINLGVK